MKFGHSFDMSPTNMISIDGPSSQRMTPKPRGQFDRYQFSSLVL